MVFKQFDIWLANLNPRAGTEPGKVRPVVIVQTDLLKGHPSTIVCPITTNVKVDADILRVHLQKADTKLKQPCDIMVDQIRALDNKRFIEKLGTLSEELRDTLRQNISIVLDLN